MPDWIDIAKIADCPSGSSLELVANDKIIALYNVDGKFHAIDGVCAHQGGPLGKGELVDCIVTCPWHGWQFDVTTGQHQLNPTVKQDIIEVRVENETVFVRL